MFELKLFSNILRCLSTFNLSSLPTVTLGPPLYYFYAALVDCVESGVLCPTACKSSVGLHLMPVHFEHNTYEIKNKKVDFFFVMS